MKGRKFAARSRIAHKGKGKKKGRAQTVEATARGQRHGLLCLQTDEGETLLCERTHTGGALYGDRVLAERRGVDRASVRKVLLRAHEHIVGVLADSRHGYYLEPMERHLPREIALRGPFGDAREGDIVRVRVVRWDGEGGLLAQIEDRLGSLSQARVALDALIESEHLPTRFDADALAQAEACRPADLRDDPGREDLRDVCLFTIDGWDAKDFDDAVSLQPLPGGGARLGVHIADVGHYVPQGTPLDRTALFRGTSVYLPGRVLPMLPEALSNGVCSLRPDEDKFTLSALMDVAPSGEVTRLRLARTITRSRARLVYGDVNAMFDGDEAQIARMEALGVREALLSMRALAHRIRARHEKMGCVDFELDEPEFELDESGEPTAIRVRARGEAERMIEDFMLAANESVARFARERGLPLLYRVHERPDPEKLADFATFLDGLGVDSRGLRHHAEPGELRAVLEATRERPEYPVIAALAVRSMQKARYDAKPLGHYGLAMADYCHFTSPIRRYPDLVVSRALTAALSGEKATLTGEPLSEAALRSSERERVAAEAERAADKLMTARYMAGHVGEEYDGTVSGVCEYGVYVTLQNGAEGLVHVRTLNDWFDFDERRLTLRGERTGRTFQLGQALRVRVTSVELAACTIDLELVEGRETPRSERKRERERMRAFTR